MSAFSTDFLATAWVDLLAEFGDTANLITYTSGGASTASLNGIQKDLVSQGPDGELDLESCSFLLQASLLHDTPGPGAEVTKSGKTWKVTEFLGVDYLVQGAIVALRVSRRKRRDAA